MSTSHKVDTVRGAQLYEPLWNPEADLPGDDEVAAFMTESVDPRRPGRDGARAAARPGRRRAVRLRHFGIDLDTDNWFSPFLWALGAEIGLGLAEPDVAAASYAKLAPYRGTCVVAGTSPAHGPVDAYLALAAAATGEKKLATQHAEHALELVSAWRIPRVEKWFLNLRDRHGF